MMIGALVFSLGIRIDKADEPLPASEYGWPKKQLSAYKTRSISPQTEDIRLKHLLNSHTHFTHLITSSQYLLHQNNGQARYRHLLHVRAHCPARRGREEGN
jgi:hypothetical protein